MEYYSIKSNKKKRHPNPLHLEVQRNTRVQIVQPKKGKGSYSRSKYKKFEY